MMTTPSAASAFHGGDAPEPATLGTYGQAPVGYRLPAATRLGVVRLQVANLARSLDWYRTVLGVRVGDEAPGSAVLTAQGSDVPLIELVERPGALPLGRNARFGLFHFAILLPTRGALAAFVRHLSVIGARAGSGDHVVSEAFYLNDPDGLGIEVYADRPRETWRQVRGQMVMGTEPVNVADLLASSDEPWAGMPAGTVIGHVHLHVGDLAAGAAFYSEALGFDRIVWSYPGALFLAAGGYHHHLGTNTWAGPQARPPMEGDARLLEWTMVLPTADDVGAVAASLAHAGHAVTRDGTTAIVVRDPWGTAVRVRAE